MLYTVTLRFERPDVDSYAAPEGTYDRAFTVETEAYSKAAVELTTALVIEAMNVRPGNVSTERGGERRAA